MTEQTQQESIHSGSSFEDFLEEEGICNEVEGAAIKRVLAWQFEQEMKKHRKTKQGMAKALKTSRSQLDRLLDPANTAVSWETFDTGCECSGEASCF
jgi:antitoxin HicB